MRSRFHPYVRFCHKLRQQQLLRHLPQHQNLPYDFSHNDYLGFSQHPLLIETAMQAAQRYGIGSKSSRLIHTPALTQELETLIADSKKTARALIFTSGFQANVSVLSALLDPKVLGAQPLVFSDRLNHASFHMACQMHQIKQQRFRHLDYEHLNFLLKKNKSSGQPKFILTESVFSMDGDIADLSTLIKLAKDNQAILYVDEAHATGLFGPQGYGLSTDFPHEIDVIMGTFSKALGSNGAYVACSKALQRFFANRCQGLIYSTSPSPLQLALMHKAWELVPSMQHEVKQLYHQAEQLRQALNTLGYQTGTSCTHIIPVLFSQPQVAINAQKFLMMQGIKVSAIRPPSVPALQSRLRISLSTQHTPQAIAALIQALKSFKCEADK